MKKLLLPIILALLALAGGGFAGHMLKAPPPAKEAAEAGDKAANTDGALAEGVPETGKGENPDPAGREEAAHSSAEDDVEKPRRDFIKLDRQFVVPVLDGDKVVSLVVLSIAIEVDEGSGDSVFAQEPKIRDAFLRVLFTHAQSRGFDGEFTRESRLADLRGSLKEAARRILGKLAHGVLLTNIVRQDV